MMSVMISEREVTLYKNTESKPMEKITKEEMDQVNYFKNFVLICSDSMPALLVPTLCS